MGRTVACLIVALSFACASDRSERRDLGASADETPAVESYGGTWGTSGTDEPGSGGEGLIGGTDETPSPAGKSQEPLDFDDTRGAAHEAEDPFEVGPDGG